MSLYNFCFDLFFGRVIFSHALQERFYRNMITLKKKRNIQKTHIHILLVLFLNFSESIRIVKEPSFRAKDKKTRYIRNNNGLTILTLELWRKTKHKEYEKHQFCTQRIERILSLHKNSEKYNEWERSVLYKKLYINILQYSQENTCVGLFGFRNNF